MSLRQSIFAYSALLLGVFASVLSFARPTIGQQAVSAPAAVGRYQISTSGELGGHHVYAIDTMTGKVWRAARGSNPNEPMKWDEMTPLPVKR